jgi:hypothetical protein
MRKVLPIAAVLLAGCAAHPAPITDTKGAAAGAVVGAAIGAIDGDVGEAAAGTRC